MDEYYVLIDEETKLQHTKPCVVVCESEWKALEARLNEDDACAAPDATAPE